MTRHHESEVTAVAHHPSWVGSAAPLAVPPQRRPGAPAWMQIPAFRDLPEAAIERLQSVMQPRTYAIDMPLMRQGEAGDGFWVLDAGRVRVTVCDENSVVVFSRFMDAPGVLGEAAVLTGETLYIGKPYYRPYTSAPIKLQAHGDPSPPISFRNIWVRELP